MDIRKSMDLLLVPLMLVCVAAGAQQSLSNVPQVFSTYGQPITLEQARMVLAGAEAEAARLKQTGLVIAIVQPSGALVIFEKMDNATYNSIGFAQTKASAAARSRRPTGPPPADMVASMASLPDFVALPGGLPIVVGGKTIGAIGISGGDGPGSDAVIGQAGIKALK